MPPAPLFEPANRIVTISERGKPAQKCRLLQQWTQPNGGEAYQVLGATWQVSARA
jgi:hypothetical protein